jgi:hypothetical protein
MMLKQRVKTVFLSASLVLLGVSCALWRSDKAPATPEHDAAAAAPGTYTEGERESALRNMINARIEMAGRHAEERRSRVITRKPYFFKEYEEYPEGPNAFELVQHETELRTAPIVANVRIPKIRYAIRFHRDRDAAKADENFLRDTGEETITYEFRYGKWAKAGSLFVVEKTEEYVGGQWAPAQEQVALTVSAEEEQAGNWWDRTLSWLTGR